MTVDQIVLPPSISIETGHQGIHPVSAIAFGFLAFNTLIGFALAANIKQRLRILYPQVWKNLGYGDISVDNISRSTAFISLIYRPPAEITNENLLKDFSVYKLLIIGQMILFLFTAFSFVYFASWGQH